MEDGRSSGSDAGSPSWRADLIRHYPVFSTLAPGLAARMSAQGRAVAVPAGTIAFDEHSPCDGLTLPTSGSIRVVRGSAEGREILLYRVEPGESCILSVCCLLGRSAYTARGIVETDVTGVTLPAGLFDLLVTESPAFRAFVFELFAARVTDLMQLVDEVAFHRLDARIAALLLRRFAATGASEIEATHQDLADQVGSVREIVSRILQALQGRGAVTLGRGRVQLVDAAVLEDIAGDLADA